MGKKTIFKKADIILAVILLVLGLGSMFLLKGEQGGRVRVSVDGKEYGEYSLSKDQTVRIEALGGYNVMEIKNGKVSVTDADCLNHDCMGFAPIGSEGQIILCLPHHLSVQIIGKEAETDARTY